MQLTSAGEIECGADVLTMHLLPMFYRWAASPVNMISSCAFDALRLDPLLVSKS
jgi:hypothetical protein